MHGVRRELLRAGRLTRLPLHEVWHPPAMRQSIYEAAWKKLRLFHDQSRTVAFGDIFSKIFVPYPRKPRPHRHDRAFPLWKRDTRELLHSFTSNTSAPLPLHRHQSFDPSFAGRDWTNPFFRNLPPHADPCGEKRGVSHLRLRWPDFSILHSHSNGEMSPRWFCVFDLLRNGGSNKMNAEMSHKQNLLYRMLLALP